MPSPTTDPGTRANIPPADSYGPGARIWVHRGATGWRPGRVEAASPTAAMVTYRPTGAMGTAVDTVTAVHLAPRTEDDPMDHPQSRPGSALPIRPRPADHDQDRARPGPEASR